MVSFCQAKKLNYHEKKLYYELSQKYIDELCKIEPLLGYSVVNSLECLQWFEDRKIFIYATENQVNDVVSHKHKFMQPFKGEETKIVLITETWCKVLKLPTFFTFPEKYVYDMIINEFVGRKLLQHSQIYLTEELANACQLPQNTILLAYSQPFYDIIKSTYISDIAVITQKQCAIFKEELIQKTMRPDRILKLLNSGIDINDLDEFI
jgi:hypothetical protein